MQIYLLIAAIGSYVSVGTLLFIMFCLEARRNKFHTLTGAVQGVLIFIFASIFWPITFIIFGLASYFYDK